MNESILLTTLTQQLPQLSTEDLRRLESRIIAELNARALRSKK